MPQVLSSNAGRGKKFTKVMGSYGNCKYLPTFSLSYVKYAFVTVYDCIISYGMCGVNLALV